MYNYVDGVQLPRNSGVNGQFGYTVSGLRRLKPEIKKNLFCIPKKYLCFSRMQNHIISRRGSLCNTLVIRVFLFEPGREKSGFFAYAKTKTQISFAVTAKLISVFVFATWMVQYLYFLNPKFQVSSYIEWLCSPVCVGPGRKPRRPVFRRRGLFIGYGDLWELRCPDGRPLADYSGNVSVTDSGRTCLGWHEYVKYPRMESLHYNESNGDANYCRNKDMPSPWCYTADWWLGTSIQSCSERICGGQQLRH